MSSQAIPPKKYASNTDYTSSVNEFTIVVLVLCTVAIVARCYGRYLAKNVDWGIDDALAVLGWLGLVANSIANFIMAATNLVSTTPPTPEQVTTATKAMFSVGITYPVSVVASKMSLLFLLRRIFGMRVLWFKFGWWITFVLLFPVWTTVAFTFAALGIAKAMSLEVTFKYAVPSVTFINTVTDLCMLVLPIGMTRTLQLSWQQRLSISFIFVLGSAGFIISLLRSTRNLQSNHEGWDPRYQVYSEVMLGIAEAGTILICACLPVTRPLYLRFKEFTKRSVSNITNRDSRHTNISLGSQEFNDEYNDDAPINMKAGVIHRRMEYQVNNHQAQDYPPNQAPYGSRPR